MNVCLLMQIRANLISAIRFTTKEKLIKIYRGVSPEKGFRKRMQIEVGSVVEGKVTGIAAFGAFIELEGGKTGLVHISEVASEYVSDISQKLKEGQNVKVKVISIENDKISLSIKKAENPEFHPKKDSKGPKQKRQNNRPRQVFDSKQPPEEFEFVQKKSGEMSFDDMLQKFKQDSDEKFQDLKRSNESKRSGGYKRAY